MEGELLRVQERAKRRRILLWSAPFLLLFVYWNTVSFGGASAQIVDESSGKPLQDVVVVATWTLSRSISGGWVGYAEVQEARTDSKGVFHLPAWGPRFRLRGSIYPIEPQVRAFRSGYLPLDVHGVGTTLGKAPVLRMRPVSRMEYKKSFDEYLGELMPRFFMTPFECAWQQIPQMIAALQAESRALGDSSLKLFDAAVSLERVNCR